MSTFSFAWASRQSPVSSDCRYRTPSTKKCVHHVLPRLKIAMNYLLSLTCSFESGSWNVSARASEQLCALRDARSCSRFGLNAFGERTDHNTDTLPNPGQRQSSSRGKCKQQL